MKTITDLLKYIQDEIWDTGEFLAILQQVKTIPVEAADALVTILAEIAINQTDEALTLLQKKIEIFNINVANARGDTALHALMYRLKNLASLDTIAWLLRHGADFTVVNSERQTPFHLFMQHAPPKDIKAIWKTESIWEKLRTIQHVFDVPDAYGKKPIHYLMAREDHADITEVINYYYWCRDILSADAAGNTPCHVAAQTGIASRVDFFLNLTNLYSGYRLRNAAGQTPADVARAAKHFALAGKLYQLELDYTPFYKYLRKYFQQRAADIVDAAVVSNYQDKILSEFPRLMRIIQIPSSELDESIAEILAILEISFDETLKGYELPLPDMLLEQLDERNARKLYELTVIGKLEAALQNAVRKSLVEYIQGTDNYSLQQKIYDEQLAEYEAQWAAYEERMATFEDGDEGHDYDGPVQPEKPNILYPEIRRIRRALAAEYTADVLADVEQLLTYMTLSEGLLGDILYNRFSVHMVEEIIAALNCAHLNLEPQRVSAILKSIDYQFPDIDITKPGFLIDIFKLNFKDSFTKTYLNYDIDSIFKAVIAHLADSPLIDSVREYNDAAKRNDSLAQQKIWLKLQPTVDLVFQKTRQQDKKKNNALNQEITTAKQQAQTRKDIDALIKVFPTDQCDHIVYKPSIGVPIEQPLRPIFKTLYSIARGTHELIVANSAKKETEKTNVVAAMLSFVVGIELAGAENRKKPAKIVYVNIPIVLDYPSLLLSRDAADKVFSGDGEFTRSVAEDRQRGAEIVGKQPKIDVASTAVEAKHILLTLIGSLSCDNEALRAQIDAATVTNPIQLEHVMKKDVQKSTETFHSERIYLHALKQPGNLQRIFASLRQNLQSCLNVKNLAPGTYVIYSANLILYSYPNTVCDECSVSFIGMQNSHEQGFIRCFTDVVHNPQSQSAGQPQFKINGYDPVSHKIDPRLFHVTVIAAAHQIFKNDAHSKLVTAKPDAKLLCMDPNLLSAHPGVIVPEVSAYSSKHIYEFVETKVQESLEQVPYAGFIAMSGTKEGKLKKNNNIETSLQQLILDENKNAGALNPPIQPPPPPRSSAVSLAAAAGAIGKFRASPVADKPQPATQPSPPIKSAARKFASANVKR